MAVAGMRGTGSWSADERPKNYREMVLYLYPHERSPLLAMLGKLAEEAVDDPEFKVFIKGLPAQRALNEDVYNNTDNPLTLHLKTANDYKMFKVGHVIINERTLEVMWVTAAASGGGAGGQLTLTRAIGSQALVAGLADDGLLVVGSRHAEGADVPGAIMYDPSVISNYCQIFRNSLDQTNTARATRLRTGDQIKSAQKECMLLHHVEMEKAFLFGVAHEGTGTNGQPERGTRGMLFHITSNVKDYTAGLDIDTFENDLEDIFRYGSNEKLWLGGARTINCLNKLARVTGHMVVDVPATETYGMAIQRWLTPFGSLLIKVHPLMSENSTFNKWAFIFDMGQLRYRYLKGRDTKYLKDRQTPGLDAIKDEYLTEAGLEGRFQETHAVVKNLSSVVV
jgi:hypothetical protein